MEAVREHPAAPTLATDASDLPPPPAPFPVDQLGSHLDADAAERGRPSASEATAQAQRDLTAVQTSCVAALTSLLPAGDNARQILSLSAGDSRLAAALTDLLETTYELDGLDTSPAYQEEGATQPEEDSAAPERDDFAVLAEHLDALVEGNQLNSEDGHTTIGTLRQRLLWERVRTLSHVVKVLMETRAFDEAEGENDQSGADQFEGTAVDSEKDSSPTTAHPPTYNDDHSLPIYRPRESMSSEDLEEKDGMERLPSGSSTRTGAQLGDEKRMRELDDLTMAIERLGQAAPQYHDQRSELRPRTRQSERDDPLAEKEQVSVRLPSMSQKDKMKELEEIWHRIERAHGKRRMRDQDADMELVGDRRKEQRERYLQDLYDRAEASRMSNQDASFREVDTELDKARLLRQRGKFLQHLVETSADTRLSNQDATSPLDRRQDFVQDVVERSAAARMTSQDYPISASDRLRNRKDNFMDSLVEYSSSGRLVGQDSNPPTPRVRDQTQQQERKNPFDLVTAEDFLKNLPALHGNDQPNGSDIQGFKGRSTPDHGNGEEKEKGTASTAGGTLRRIKGMVKNKSISLGLSRAPTGGAVDGLNYVAEYHENLDSIAFMLFGPGLPLSTEVSVSTPGGAQGSDDATLKIGPTATTIFLPTSAGSGQSVTLTPSAGTHIHLEGKLAALPSKSAPHLLGTRYPLSAADLRQLEPTGICCAACDRIVASLSPARGATRWKDLPSEHWAEMIEIWMCHQDPTWTSKLAQHTEQGFWPDKGGLLVGGSYLLVNKEDARRANMVYTKGKDPAWDIISCLCGEPLGKARAEDERPGSGTVRLAKWSIALLREDDECGENVEPIRASLGVFITADMLELAQAHASYRFIVRDEDTDEKRILIWLFNPSLAISFRQSSTSPLPSPFRSVFQGSGANASPSTHSARLSGSSSISRRSSIASSSKSLARVSSSGDRNTSDTVTSTSRQNTATTKSLRVCKIMYRILEKGEQFRPPGFGPPPGDNQPNLPDSQLQVEDLRYPGQVCERLGRALRASTEVYPAGARRMGVWDVGFLERE